jgi:pantoate--beta-alanine ligase
MKTVRTVAELRRELAGPEDIGLVPTMGFLHEGHLSLVRRAREDCATVVVSLFVNPKQFGEGEDLYAYPRDEARDAALAEEAGADFLFAPANEEVYPDGFATTVEVAGLTDVLCGGARPGHFAGVTTVVAKLFNIVQPDFAVFGQKDLQQAALIRRMVSDLDFGIEIDVAPIVREPDGLAMSSRNSYLDPDERSSARALSQALAAAQRAFSAGQRAPAALVAGARAVLQAAGGVREQYVELVDPETLDTPEHARPGDALAIAAFVGSTRLIDNQLLV